MSEIVARGMPRFELRPYVCVGFLDIAGFSPKTANDGRSALGRTIFYLIKLGNWRADLCSPQKAKDCVLASVLHAASLAFVSSP